MKIAIPSSNGKLCGHFGHCDEFTFVDVENNEMTNIVTDAPDGGVSCQCATWIAEQNVDIVLAGGIGGRPSLALQELGIKLIAGCPELEIKELVNLYLNKTLKTGVNTCGHDSNHQCHGDGEGHHCGHKH